MTNMPKDKTPSEVKRFDFKREINAKTGIEKSWAEECSNGRYILFFDHEAAIQAERQKRCSNCECHTMEICIRCATTMKEKIASLKRELAEAKEKLLWCEGCNETMRENSVENAKHIASLTAENERLTIKATNWEITALGAQERIKALEGALRGIVENEVPSDAQWKAAEKALASPTRYKHDADVTCSNCRGDSAGPEKEGSMMDIEREAKALSIQVECENDRMVHLVDVVALCARVRDEALEECRAEIQRQRHEFSLTVYQANKYANKVYDALRAKERKGA